MRRLGFLAVILFSVAPLIHAELIYRIDLRGKAQVFSKDRPVQRGRVLLFHRYPDGLFTSVAEAEVVRIVAATVTAKTEALLPGESIVLGPTGGETSSREGSEEATSVALGALPGRSPRDNGYGYSYYGYFGGAPRRSVAPPRSVVTGPPLVGPNGFPILASPGSPGGTPPIIGPNGFPIPSNALRRFSSP